MSPRVEGNAHVAITATRALPVPTEPTGYAKRTPVRSGHEPIQHGTPRGYERHKALGGIPCKDCAKSVDRCGTPAGYEHHHRFGQTPCAACKAAHAAWRAEGKARTHERRGTEIQHGTLAGYQRCAKTHGGACDDCKEASRAYQRNRRASKPKPARKPYTPPPPTFDVQAAARDYKAGQSIRDLSIAYGVSRETMRRHLGKAGVDIRPNIKGNPIDAAKVVELYGQGLTLSEIAARLGVTYSGAYKALRGADVAVRDDRGNQHRRAS